MLTKNNMIQFCKYCGITNIKEQKLIIYEDNIVYGNCYGKTVLKKIWYLTTGWIKGPLFFNETFQKIPSDAQEDDKWDPIDRSSVVILAIIVEVDTEINVFQQPPIVLYMVGFMFMITIRS